MAKIKIGDKEYNMRFTLGFWERIKSECDVTQSNMEQRLQEDFGTVASNIVYYGVYYGSPLELRDKFELTLEEIKESLDASVGDAIEETLIEGMTKAQKELVEIARKHRTKKLEEIVGKDDDQKNS